ncbi:LysR family transcriptional regulator [Phreatobacter stygius]|uniref:LysR family transcriptional regulator n=1 Tax=Phreatobacter stygius TaxID=1940610 RepID=A0A4D7BCZ8_9HYPH|nr:LysR family transcriptional regulator [Phreatobacter stygius]QCI65852.1 LysR family transcriptional regulator [Phreatobacter stygius]
MAVDLNLLLLFAEIAETPNLSRAAKRLGVSRSSISQRLKVLERQMGAQLLRRTTRRVDLTDAGRTAYEHAIRIREDASAVQAAMAGHTKHPRGHVRLSVPTGLGRLVLAPVLIDFLARYPDITLQVSFSNRVGDLIAGNIDVAVRIMSDPPDTVVARELCPVEWRLCAAPDLVEALPVANPDDLAGHAIVAPPPAGRDHVIQLRRNGRNRILSVVPRVQAEDFLFLQDALMAGAGIGMLPDYMADPAISDGRLMALLTDYQVIGPGDRILLLTTPTAHPAPAVRALVEFLRASVPDWALARRAGRPPPAGTESAALPRS